MEREKAKGNRGVEADVNLLPWTSRGAGGSVAAGSPSGEKPPRVWCVVWGSGGLSNSRVVLRSLGLTGSHPLGDWI